MAFITAVEMAHKDGCRHVKIKVVFDYYLVMGSVSNQSQYYLILRRN